jgi:adenylyltransferase/sulfurtransferase
VVKLKKIFLLVLCLALFAGCTLLSSEESQEMENGEETINGEVVEDQDDEMAAYMDVTPEEAKDLIDNNPNLVVIDVSPHYDDGHLPGAVHYYLGDGSLDDAIPILDPEGEYLVYCHVDSVAISGAQKLIDAGFDTVYRLEGNYGGWVDAGYPIEK